MADELISRKDAIEFFQRHFGSVQDAVIAVRMLNELDTIDAVPVAECKKCAEKTHDCIIKLQKQIEQLVRERDATFADLKKIGCDSCAYKTRPTKNEPCLSCDFGFGFNDNWKWRCE